MSKNAPLILLTFALNLTGCTSIKSWFDSNPTPAWSRPGWSPEGRLKIAVVDETKREPNGTVSLYQPNDSPPDHRLLAFISAEGNAEEEGSIVNMMLDYAKHIGASGIVLLRNEKPNLKAEVNVPSIYERPGRRIFRANVILAK